MICKINRIAAHETGNFVGLFYNTVLSQISVVAESVERSILHSVPEGKVSVYVKMCPIPKGI